jgi:hypothetical protein
MKVLDLPEECLLSVREFLVYKENDIVDISILFHFNMFCEEDWRNFMNSTKLFEETKRKSVRFYLFDAFALEFCTNADFRIARVLKNIVNPFAQLSVHFSKVEYQDHFFYHTELAVLNSLRLVDISFNHFLRDVSMLHNNRTLCLNGCNSIIDLSSLQNVQELHFESLRFATFPYLPNLYKLNLSSSDYIKDVSTMSHVHSLDLSDCPSITDVSKLGRVHTLNLSGNFFIRDVSALSQVHQLNLSNCTGIHDVSMLGSVHWLDLSFCSGITDVSQLGKVFSLNLSGCKNISDVSALGGVVELNLSRCPKVQDVNPLGRVKWLNLSHCPLVVDVSALGAVKRLILRNCRGVRDVSMLGSVEELDLSDCRKLEGLQFLGKVKNLTLF